MVTLPDGILNHRKYGEKLMRAQLIIFDMDGVLIDVTGSYRAVTRLSVILYLSKVIGVEKLDDDFISLQDVAAIKRTGGLNNDWDLTCAILDAVLKLFFDETNSGIAGKMRDAAVSGSDLSVLESAGRLLRRCDTSRIKKESVQRSAREIFFESLKQKKSTLQDTEPSPFLLNRGDVKFGNIVKRIFQEIYLGKKLFMKNYDEMPLFFNETGYIERERLIPTRGEIESLHHDHILSIATGRPENEAIYALDFFGIRDLFTAVVTEDDIVRGEKTMGSMLRKPHPFGIDLCIEKSGYHKGRDVVYYIGDMPDDMTASKRAGTVSIGFVNDAATENVENNEEKKAHMKLLVDRGAIRVFNNYRELISFFSDLKK
jgi:phosphoglycolate phosphatase-like HAD superfamily hydrolase